MAEVPKIRGVKKIVNTEVIPFTRQLASMSGAGMPILTTMQTLEEQSGNPEFKKVLTHMRATIEGGDPLATGQDEEEARVRRRGIPRRKRIGGEHISLGEWGDKPAPDAGK